MKYRVPEKERKEIKELEDILDEERKNINNYEKEQASRFR